MKLSNVFFLLSSLLILHACYPESDGDSVLIIPENPNTNNQDDTRSYDNVDTRLWPYYMEFEDQAALRGYEIDLNFLGISGAIKEITDEGVAGTCQYGQHVHHVTVDKDYWNQSSSVGREFVVFHELGHCVLARDHRESMNAEGLCLSIMASGTGDCRFAYTSNNRKAYLDELFYYDNLVL